MSVISGVNVSKSFGSVDVFVGLTFSLARGDKVALVGPNGCGKTTLLRILAGEDEPNSGGQVHVARGVSRGYLAQTAERSDPRTPWQLAQSALVDLNPLQARLAQLEAALAQPNLDPAETEALLRAYGEVQHAFEAQGGYTVDARIRRVLDGLGLPEPLWHTSISALSGGQRVRAFLAHLLLRSPDVLLLDEPTNHLDTAGVEWLEACLQAWEGTLVVVSHDRYFLDEVCDQVWEMQPSPGGSARLAFYRGSYTDYVQQRAEQQARAQAEYEAQQALIAKETEYIRRNLAGQNSAQAKGRLRRLNRIERLERPTQQRALTLRLESGTRSGERVLEAHNLVVGYDRPLLRIPELLLLRGERVAVVGPNGIGKTTLLKTLLGELPPLAGEVRRGASVRIGYFAQAHEGLDPAHTLLESVLAAQQGLTLSEARAWLGRFLFSGDDHFKPVAVLSGGERGRLALARLALQGANLLLLDEPTNHLDIPSQEALTQALQDYEGTLVFVSHDRYLIAALATQLWVLERDKQGEAHLTVFKGSYDAWRETRERLQPPPLPSAQPSPASAPAQRLPASKNALRQQQAKLQAIEQTIQTLEARLASLSAEMQAAGNDFVRLRALGEAYRETEQALAEAWAEFERMLE
ncbi:MAG: ABC-F family ATP-binding cassette domain-containing protein [Thermoflexales bacterium]|nr:ABC-F family ATP-binding cassette domain-containing protein [Thermoflexales bacterium]